MLSLLDKVLYFNNKYTYYATKFNFEVGIRIIVYIHIEYHGPDHVQLYLFTNLLFALCILGSRIKKKSNN